MEKGIKIIIGIMLGILLLFGIILIGGFVLYSYEPEFKESEEIFNDEEIRSSLAFETIVEASATTVLKGQTISQGSFSGHEDKEYYVIKENSEWKDLWETVFSQMTPEPSVPEINFEEEMIIAVFQGSFSTGGYSIEIIDIFEKENSIGVFVEETSPSPDAMTIQAFTQPYHIIKVERIDKEVNFVNI